MEKLSAYAPQMLSVLRIMSGLIFMAHGTMKILNFPPAAQPVNLATMGGVAGLFELIGGALIARLAELKRRVNSVRTMSAMESFHEPAELTPREWEILRLIEQGMSNQEIANSLVIEMGTVKNHVHNILRKLDVQSRKHAVIFARQQFARTGVPSGVQNGQRTVTRGPALGVAQQATLPAAFAKPA